MPVRGFGVKALALAVAAMIGVAAIAAAISAIGTAPRDEGRATVANLPKETTRVAIALGLSPRATVALGRAHAFGQAAADCLIRHGGHPVDGGGISDPGGRAAATCRSVLAANEQFLASAAFAKVLAEARAAFDVGTRCHAQRTRIFGEARVSPSGAPAASAIRACFRRDGLPRTRA